MYYHKLPDGLIIAFATKGGPKATPDYIAPNICKLDDNFESNNSDMVCLSNVIQVPSKLPILFASTFPRKYWLQQTTSNGVDE